MKLIKDLGTFKNNTKSYSEKRGLFFCPGCSQLVEKRMDAGKIAKSCGCLRYKEAKVKHGETKTLLYRKWTGMKTRCYNKTVRSYPHYGGRGIAVCNEWFEFLNFREWAKKNGYKDYLSIERINNDGDYCPDNCTFITMAEQQRNRQDTKLNLAKVKLIRKLWKQTDLTQEKIGGFFNITAKYVSKIVKNKVWKNLETICLECHAKER